MIIGYSFWGFLGPGIRDTPDGGRSHRRTLIDGLLQRGHDIVFLQRNRDLHEAGDDFTDSYRWHDRLPTIDALLLEWRWPIPGRNTTECSAPGHTCDLHRQHELLAHYTAQGTPTLLWDKDRQLAANDPLRKTPNVVVCEPARHPSPNAMSLLFPVADSILASADPVALAASPRDMPLVYVGNQYDRDDAFDRYFAPAARRLPHIVAGKWPDTARWPGLNFCGRVPFGSVESLHRRAVATVLLLPDRYAIVGQVTQRLFEAVLAGCLPLTPTNVRAADRFTPSELHVRDGHDTLSKIEWLISASAHDRARLLQKCLDRLDPFRLSRQLDVIDDLLWTLRKRTGPQ